MNKKANNSLQLTRRATSDMDWLSMLLFELYKVAVMLEVSRVKGF